MNLKIGQRVKVMPEHGKEFSATVSALFKDEPCDDGGYWIEVDTSKGSTSVSSKQVKL